MKLVLDFTETGNVRTPDLLGTSGKGKEVREGEKRRKTRVMTIDGAKPPHPCQYKQSVNKCHAVQRCKAHRWSTITLPV